MSEGRRQRLRLIRQIERGELTVTEVARLLELSIRQVQRIRKRVESEGDFGVLHGNAGRPPKHRVNEETRRRILELHRDKYQGFNDQHFAEKLEVEGIIVSRETVRRMLRAAGRPSPRRRRAPKHRRRRDRRSGAGQMILWGGSWHDWLEGRGPKTCLMASIDDATGELLDGAHFTDRECALGYLRLLRGVLVSKGIPQAVYGDRHGALRRNDKHWTLEEELAGAREPTQVRLALDRMNIQVHCALSPQAKGRIERAFGTLQDRLISELRLAGAKTRGEANEVLKRYRLEHNRRFAVAPESQQSGWRQAPRDHRQLLELCALQYSGSARIVGRQSARCAARWQGRWPPDRLGIELILGAPRSWWAPVGLKIPPLPLKLSEVQRWQASCLSGGPVSPRPSDDFRLPPAKSTKGAFVRLFLAECRNPLARPYNHPGAERSMLYMKAAVFGRLREGPKLFGADVPPYWGWVGRKNPPYHLVEAIIKAPGQFAGFKDYPILTGVVQSRINEVLRWCRAQGGPSEQMGEFVNIALHVAAVDLPMPSAVPNIDRICGWRTQGRGPPGGTFKARPTEIVMGNAFYELDRSS